MVSTDQMQETGENLVKKASEQIADKQTDALR